MDWSQEDIYDYFEDEGYRFSAEILTRYALSLQTKPFVILTGISGTGKTKIAQVFADYMCQGLSREEKAKKIAFIPVRPDWMDNRGLLGYYNPLTQTYQATPMLRLLLEAAKPVNKGEPFFVILDEMNLAKVEYYFSDFLSLLESRTQGKATGEPLRLHDMGGAVMTDDGLDIPSQMDIPANVYFTGTVNVDESTYMFSPKVLDRANVIEFNEVVLPGYEEEDKESHRFAFKQPDLRKRLPGESGRPFCSLEDFKQYQGLLDTTADPIAGLYQRLRPYHLHFGYRVINEIARFVVLADQALVNGLDDLDDTMDIAFLQKILPKLHGTQARLQAPLRDILTYCGCYDGPPTSNQIDQAVRFDRSLRYPRTAQKVARMLRQLDAQGYASFIE